MPATPRRRSSSLSPSRSDCRPPPAHFPTNDTSANPDVRETPMKRIGPTNISEVCIEHKKAVKEDVLAHRERACVEADVPKGHLEPCESSGSQPRACRQSTAACLARSFTGPRPRSIGWRQTHLGHSPHTPSPAALSHRVNVLLSARILMDYTSLHRARYGCSRTGIYNLRFGSLVSVVSISQR